MAVVDGSVVLAPDSSGKSVDNSVVTRSDNTTQYRQRTNTSDPSDPNAHAAVRNQDPAANDYGIVVRPAFTNEETEWRAGVLNTLRAIMLGIEMQINEGSLNHVDLYELALGLAEDEER